MATSRITVSKSKRGTTVKATGSAAQALFDAMTETPTPPADATVSSQAERDLMFLEELLCRLEKGRRGDATQLDYVEHMLGDWRDELQKALELESARKVL